MSNGSGHLIQGSEKMTVTGTKEVENQIQTFWSDLFMQEFRETHALPSLVNKDYEGEIRDGGGDTVRVSQIIAAQGENRTIGVDADSFAAEKLQTVKVDVKADKRAVASFKFNDLVWLQSQIGKKDSEVRAALLHGLGRQINNYLYSLVAPSLSNPTHSISGVADMNSTELSKIRKLAAQALWMRNKPWWGLLDPSHYTDVIDDNTMSSSSYTDDKPMVAGQIAQQRFGFNLIEDNSEGLTTHLSAGTPGVEDKSIFFHPDFMLFVMQTQPRFKVSDLHANEQFGFVISVDLVYGATMGIDGEKKVIEAYNS